MRKTFFKNLLRDIKKTLSMFLSIVVIIAVGVAFYSGVRATSPDMQRSGDFYLNKQNFMDFRLISTMGLTKDDISEIKKLKGITEAEGGFTIDAVYEKDKESQVLNINSIPRDINRIRLVKGRMAEKNDEVVIEDRFITSNKLKIGDTIEFKSGKETELSNNLSNTRFTIVGSAKSPLYMSVQRQLSSVAGGVVRGFAYVRPGVFKSSVFTEAFVRMADSRSDVSLLKNSGYKDAADSIEKGLKDLGITRCEVRYHEVYNEASGKITNAENDLNKSKQEAQTKFADAHKKLNDAKNEIAGEEKKLKDSEKLLERSIAEGEKKISEGHAQIAAGRKKLDEEKKSAAGSISAAVQSKLEEAGKALQADPGNQALIAQYGSLKYLFDNYIKGKSFDEMYSSLKEAGAEDQMKALFDIDAIKNKFDMAQTDIGMSEKKIDASEAELNKSGDKGSADLSAGRKKIEEAKKELNLNTEKLKSEEDKAYAELDKGAEDISKNRDKLEDIKKPDWYILGRSANVGYETYRQDSERIGNIGKVFPLIFFLVAALVSLTTMTRMVQENRMQIGTFKALGYSTTSIVCHYLIYSLSASLLGCLAGLSFAFRLFPPLIMNAYNSLYAIPERVVSFDYGLALEASIIAVIFTTLSAAATTMDELREAPSSLLRPKAPKAGKVILLERIKFLWARLSFTRKVTARNIFRYKLRFFMTVIGIAACTGLMITGFGLNNGVVGATDNQFNKIYRYNFRASLKQNVNSEGKNAMTDKVLGDSDIKSVLFVYSKNGSVHDGRSGSIDAFVVVPENKDEIYKYIYLTYKNKDLSLGDDGVIITEKLSKLLNKRAGDTIRLSVNDQEKNVVVAAVTEHYIQHYVYMSPGYYKKAFGSNPEFNEFLGLIKDSSKNAEDGVSQRLTSIEKVGSVSFRSNVRIDYNKSVKSINSVVLILIISAGVLAIVVIYNLTNININERKRELATIKLLGFYNKELALYIYRENIILTIIGSLLGIVFGIVLKNLVLESAETNVLMFLKETRPVYFVYSILMTMLFSIIINLAMYKKFDKIDMIESLKSAE